MPCRYAARHDTRRQAILLDITLRCYADATLRRAMRHIVIRAAPPHVMSATYVFFFSAPPALSRYRRAATRVYVTLMLTGETQIEY